MRAPGLRLFVDGLIQCSRALGAALPHTSRQAVQKELTSVTILDEAILTVAGIVACLATPRFRSGKIIEVKFDGAMNQKRV